MSFREKSAWISMLSMSGIYGFYFWSVIHAGPQAGSLHFGGLLATVVALVVVQVVLTVAVAIFTPRDFVARLTAALRFASEIPSTPFKGIFMASASAKLSRSLTMVSTNPRCFPRRPCLSSETGTFS